mmetsp:Transcript_33348/g.72835  ORF Transcript_33348/g.72835 Transcript_33348/m.72835 type:complete len:515 (+) Transcript_33348:334-1878(+)
MGDSSQSMRSSSCFPTSSSISTAASQPVMLEARPNQCSHMQRPKAQTGQYSQACSSCTGNGGSDPSAVPFMGCTEAASARSRLRRSRVSGEVSSTLLRTRTSCLANLGSFSSDTALAAVPKKRSAPTPWSPTEPTARQRCLNASSPRSRRTMLSSAIRRNSRWHIDGKSGECAVSVPATVPMEFTSSRSGLPASSLDFGALASSLATQIRARRLRAAVATLSSEWGRAANAVSASWSRTCGRSTREGLFCSRRWTQVMHWSGRTAPGMRPVAPLVSRTPRTTSTKASTGSSLSSCLAVVQSAELSSCALCRMDSSLSSRHVKAPFRITGRSCLRPPTPPAPLALPLRTEARPRLRPLPAHRGPAEEDDACASGSRLITSLAESISFCRRRSCSRNFKARHRTIVSSSGRLSPARHRCAAVFAASDIARRARAGRSAALDLISSKISSRIVSARSWFSRLSLARIPKRQSRYSGKCTIMSTCGTQSSISIQSRTNVRIEGFSTRMRVASIGTISP